MTSPDEEKCWLGDHGVYNFPDFINRKDIVIDDQLHSVNKKQKR